MDLCDNILNKGCILDKQLTIHEAVESAARYFDQQELYYGHGTDNAFDEALSLVLYVLDLDYSITDDDLERVLSPSEQKKIDEIISQRISTRKPAVYLTHRTWFMGLEFYVDERVLVPRSPLAELIYNHYQPWVKPEAVHNILDLCTGGGCIAIASAVMFEQAHVVASDISIDALEVCKKNIATHGLEKRVEAVQSDLFENLQGRKFDLIVSNPPYVPNEARTRLPREYLHEPEIGLYSGDSGLDIPMSILRQAADYLTDDGVLIVEVGESEERMIEATKGLPLTWLEFEFGGEGVFVVSRKDL